VLLQALVKPESVPKPKGTRIVISGIDGRVIFHFTDQALVRIEMSEQDRAYTVLPIGAKSQAL
jgi:hypothetical protein